MGCDGMVALVTRGIPTALRQIGGIFGCEQSRNPSLVTAWAVRLGNSIRLLRDGMGA